MPKILAVDDSATMRKVLELTFQALDGFQIETFDSAQAAMTRAQAGGADLFIVDISMTPDGYEVCRQLKAHAATQSIPVLLLGSKQAAADEAKARGAGADDTASKPYDTKGFIERVKKLVARGASAPRPATAPAAAPEPSLKRPTLELAEDDDEPMISIDAPAPTPARPPVPGVIGRAPAPAAAGPGARPAVRHTVGFGAPMSAVRAPTPAAPTPASSPGSVASPIAERVAPAAPSHSSSSLGRPASGSSVASAAAAASSAAASVSAKLGDLGLTPEQLSAVAALTHEVVERVVWEVVPELAEAIIREEIQRLTR